MSTINETVLADAHELIKTLNLPYLERLSTIIAHEVQLRKKSAIQEAIVKIHQIASAAGISLNDIGKLKPTKPVNTKEKSVAKYQHPTDKTLQWSGKGRPPAWFAVLIKNGVKASEMEI